MASFAPLDTQTPPFAQKRQRMGRPAAWSDDGYMLVGCIVLIFVVMLMLSIAAPTIARQMQREREVETQHRANEYVRAIRVFYRKNGNRYPTSIDQLKNTNNQKFLRQEYIDPLTGKPDWRLIHVGENLTTVKGFFGTDLPGLAGPTGLSGIGGSGSSGTASSGTGASGTGTGTTGTGSGGTGTTFGSSGSGSTGSTGSTFGSSGTGSGTGSTTGSGSGSGSSPLSGGGGLIMGVGSNKRGAAILMVNGKDRYEDWEFLYDPRIEQLYAKGALNAGAPSSSGTSGSGFGSSSPGLGTGSGAPGSSPVGSSGSGSGSGTTTPH